MCNSFNVTVIVYNWCTLPYAREVAHRTPEYEAVQYGTPNPEWLNARHQIGNGKTQSTKSEMVKLGIANLK